MPNQTTTPRDRPTTGKRSPFPHPRTRRTRLVALALAVTVLTSATLTGLTLRADGDWRADTTSSVQLCLQQQSPTGAHRTRCPTGDTWPAASPTGNPCATTRSKMLAAAALTVLLVAEIGYPTRHH